MVHLLANAMHLLTTLADNVVLPDIIQNASSEVHAEFMILCGGYLTCFVYALLIFILFSPASPCTA